MALHLRLLPQGGWRDEFFTFGFFRENGLPGLLYRFLHWSPRPLSEAVIWLYWLAVRAAHRPLVAPALLVAWAIAAMFLAMAIAPWRGPGRVARLALWLGLAAAMLLAGPVSNLYYWPLGALAYLPALGAAAAVAMIAVGPGLHTNRRYWAVAALLAAGAASVEVGAFLAVSCAPGLLAVAVGSRRPSRVAAAVFTLGVGLAAMAMLVHGRVAQGSEVMMPSPLLHHPWPSLLAAVPRALAEAVRGAGDTATDPGTLAGLVAKALFAAGVYLCLARAWPVRPRPGPVLAVLAGLAGTYFLSIAAAYFEFGTLCCERHESYRQALLLLMFVTACGLAPRSNVRVAVALWGPALLALSLLPPLPLRLAGLLAEYRLAPARAAATAATFASGTAEGTGKLHFALKPDGPLLHFAALPPGAYALANKPAWLIAGPMIFLGKSAMDVTRR